MQKLDSELTRLYLQPRATQAGAPALVTADGGTRAIAIPFNPVANEEEGQHWTRLCAVANAMQAELRLPAPAVSISGTGYRLWLSLESPVPAATVARFLTLLHAAYMPELGDQANTGAPPPLPPYPLAGGEQWAAFIHPELGASFASEPALDIAPPPAGQAALLEGLHSISAQRFEHAMRELAARRAPTQDKQAHAMHAQDGHAPSAAAGVAAQGRDAGRHRALPSCAQHRTDVPASAAEVSGRARAPTAPATAPGRPRRRPPAKTSSAPSRSAPHP